MDFSPNQREVKVNLILLFKARPCLLAVWPSRNTKSLHTTSKAALWLVYLALGQATEKPRGTAHYQQLATACVAISKEMGKKCSSWD